MAENDLESYALRSWFGNYQKPDGNCGSVLNIDWEGNIAKAIKISDSVKENG